MNRKPFISKLLFLFVLFLLAGFALVMVGQSGVAVATSQLTMTQLPANHQIECLPTAYNLEKLIECVTSYMPPKNSGAFVPPSATVQDDWQLVVNDMADMTSINDCSTISLPSSLANIYAVFPFTDSYTGQDFCVAMEIIDDDENGTVDRGWGTFIVNPKPQRYLSIDIPHPMEDNYTNQEGIQIFKGVGAHTFLMAGANREANNTASPCQTGEKIADVAHCTDNFFFPAVVALDTFYNTKDVHHTAIQFHGMADDQPVEKGGCPNVNVYITHGSADPAHQNDSIVTLRDELRDLQPTWKVAVPGEPSPLVCGKNGTQNVEGRYLNELDESEVCDDQVDPVGYTSKFIHIEQHPDNENLTGFRNPAVWIEALKNTFPSLTAPPATTAISFQNNVSPDANYLGTSDNWIVGAAGDDDDNAGDAKICGMEGGTDPNDWHATLLRWDISSLPAGSTIHGAEVTLNITDSGNSTGHYAYALNPDWTESGSTWNQFTANPNDTWEIPGALGASDRDPGPIGRPIANSSGAYTFPINPEYVQSWFDSPASNNGILITNPDNGNDVHFDCSEGDTAVNRPKLTIHYSTGGTVTPTVTPTITATPTVTPTPTNTPAPPTTPAVYTFQNGVASYNGMIDTWIDEDAEDTNFGGSATCETDSDEKAALLRWDISSLPAGSTISAAEVTLRITSATDDPPGYHAYALNQNWIENQADWEEYSNGNEWELEGAQDVPADHAADSIGYAAPESTGFYTFNLDADAVQDWFDNPSANNGFILVNLSNSDGMDFYCSETGTINNRPKLTIYTD